MSGNGIGALEQEELFERQDLCSLVFVRGEDTRASFCFFALYLLSEIGAIYCHISLT
jgi:hypothetical protein